MIFILAILVSFWLIILFYKPQNLSLKDNATKSRFERIKEAKGTIALGTLILLIVLISFDMPTLKLNDNFASVFGLSKTGVFEHKLFFQILTSNFIHFDLLHLVANLSALILLVAYERRIGTSRYLTIFAISAVAASFLDLFLIRQDSLSLGASAGIAGLACGYFIDYGKLSIKEWSIGILFSLFIVGVLSIYDKSNVADIGYEINWIAHLLGVIVAAMFIKVVPGKEVYKVKEEKAAP